ncbi:MAG TPA: response regulator transcription factor [Burkholderiaceae bacterium]
MPASTLLVIADADAAPALCDGLAALGHACHAAHDLAALDAQLGARRFDLVVIDLMLHRLDGLALMRTLRTRFQLPVILISADGSAADRVVGLEMGADDCMDRPLVLRELAARVRSVLRRGAAAVAPAERSDRVRFDGWELRRGERHLSSPAGRPVPLSNAEFLLLSTFLQAPRRVVSRDDLAAKARGRELAANSRSIDLLVSRLRRKLDDAETGGDETRVPLIRSVRGLGYVFDARSVESLA